MGKVKKEKNKESVIKITNLCKSYKMFARKKDRLIETVFPNIQRHGEFKALDNLNLDLKKGEVLGVLGKNGAGKSTLLKMITGVVIPTSGEIEVKGKISSLLELGAAFNGELTGYENIYQHGQVMGLTNEQIKEKEQEIIDFADIGEHLYQPVKTYSSGMFARLAFACAINVDPDILIVDEVLSVGDMAFQLKCFKKFEEFKKKGKTIIFVTHSIVDILRNCNRTIIIDSGRKIFDGEVKEGVDLYKKIIVGMTPEQIEKNEQVSKEADLNSESIKNDKKKVKEELKKSKNSKLWKDNFSLNKDMIIYGNGKAEIIDYGIFNEKDEIQTFIENNKKIKIKMRIKFKDDVTSPIFALSVKDFRGLELCGANTLAYKIETGKFKKGDEVVIEFDQILRLAPDKYTLSFGCTRFDYNGNLEVLDRKYDSILVEVMSERDTLGIIDMNSTITIDKKEN